MRSIRFAALAALILSAVSSQTAWAQCVSYVRQIASRNSSIVLEAKSVVWTGSAAGVISEQDGSGALWLGRFDANGEALGRDTRVQDSLDAELIDFVWNGSEYGIFLIDETGDLILRRHASDGDSVGLPVHIFPKIVFAEADDVDVVWDPSRNAYVVAAVVNGASPDLWITFVQPNGTISGTERVSAAAENSFVRIARTASGIIGIFFKDAEGDDVTMLRLTGSLRQIVKNVYTTEDTVLDVVAFDNRFAFAKWDELNNNRKAVVYTLVDTSGQTVVADTRLLILYEDEEDEVLPMTIAAGDGELAIAYYDPAGRGTAEDAAFRLRRITAAGATISDGVFASADRAESRARTDREIAWTGEAWLAALERETPLGSNSFLVRLCRLVASIDAMSVVPRGYAVTFYGSAEGGSPGYSYAWSFSDGVLLAGPSVERVFAAPGTYTATLVVQDSNGEQTSDTFTISVIEPSQSNRRRAVRR
jgi:hypothetical protein